MPLLRLSDGDEVGIRCGVVVRFQNEPSDVRPFYPARPKAKEPGVYLALAEHILKCRI